MSEPRRVPDDPVAFRHPDFVLSVLVGSFLSFGYANREAAFWAPLYREDGLFEWLTFYGFVVAAVLFGAAAWRSIRLGTASHGSQWLWLSFALISILIAGEEISWGQRVFGWQTPDWLAEANKQNETNVHNLVQIGWWYPFIATAMTVVMVVARWRLRPRAPEFYRRAFPPLVQWPSLAFIFVWTVFLYQGEVVEEIAAFWSILFSAHLYRLARDPCTAP